MINIHHQQKKIALFMQCLIHHQLLQIFIGSTRLRDHVMIYVYQQLLVKHHQWRRVGISGILIVIHGNSCQFDMGIDEEILFIPKECLKNNNHDLTTFSVACFESQLWFLYPKSFSASFKWSNDRILNNIYSFACINYFYIYLPLIFLFFWFYLLWHLSIFHSFYFKQWINQ